MRNSPGQDGTAARRPPPGLLPLDFLFGLGLIGLGVTPLFILGFFQFGLAPPDPMGVDVALAAPAALDETPASPVARGEELFRANGCNACHSITGDAGLGPSLKGVHGSEQPLADGTSIIADDAYIRESILFPGARIVAGFDSGMPEYGDLLADEDVDALVAYIRTLE